MLFDKFDEAYHIIIPLIEALASIKCFELNQREKILLQTNSFFFHETCCPIEFYLFTPTNFRQGGVL